MSLEDAAARLRIRKALYQMLDEALRDPHSPEVMMHFMRLRGLGIDEPETRRMMCRVLAAYYYRLNRGDKFGYHDLIAELAQLPESEAEPWMDDMPSGADWEPKFPIAPLQRKSKVNTTDLMQDSFYVSIISQIELSIRTSDREARSRNVGINDSQVRSILNKVRKKAEGGTPKVPVVSDRDKLLCALYEDLVQLRHDIKVESDDGETEDLPTRDWLLSLRAVEDSIRLRSAGPGSRDYLNYIEEFLPEPQRQAQSEST